MNKDLNYFKTYNKFGIKRKFAPTRKQQERFLNNNSWIVEGEGNLHIYKDYKCCYITIVKNKNNMFVPSVNGSNINNYPDIIKLEREYSNLDQAKINAFIFVDKITNE